MAFLLRFCRVEHLEEKRSLSVFLMDEMLLLCFDDPFADARDTLAMLVMAKALEFSTLILPLWHWTCPRRIFRFETGLGQDRDVIRAHCRKGRQAGMVDERASATEG
jgi:hypothetical protein